MLCCALKKAAIPDNVTLEFYHAHSKEIFGQLPIALR